MCFSHGRSVSYCGLHCSFAQRIVQRATQSKALQQTICHLHLFTFKTPSLAMRNAGTKRAPSTHKWNYRQKDIYHLATQQIQQIAITHTVQKKVQQILA